MNSDNFRGRMSRPRGRGFGGDRGRGHSGGRGGGGGKGGDRGKNRGGFRGGNRGSDRGNFRGSDRGNFRGGNFRGGERGNFRGGRGQFRGGRGGANRSNELPLNIQEIRDGLQLCAVYKNVPSLAETAEQLPGFHSRHTRPVGKDGKIQHILLFTDIESLEAAKVKLTEDENIEFVDYMGMRASKFQPDSLDSRQLYVRFDGEKDKDTVKELDSRIVDVEILNNSNNCLLEFATHGDAKAVLKTLSKKVGQNGLTLVRESYGMRSQSAFTNGIQHNMVVLRDVPKTATLKDIAAVFPDAISFTLYKDTFPESKYCHASLKFDNNKRAKQILEESPDLEILDKKVYLYQAHSSMLSDVPSLGKQKFEETKNASKLVKEVSTGPPNKKQKLDGAGKQQDENNEAGEEENGSDEEMEEEEGEGEEEDDGDEEEAEGEEEEDDDDDQSD